MDGSEVEPDLMVRQEAPGIGNAWEKAPHPILIIEVNSPSTRRRDRAQKKEFYIDARIPEYWIVDPESKAITIVRPGEADQDVVDVVRWHPAGAREPFTLRVTDVFPA